MLAIPTAGRRLAGRLTVVAAVAVALPLTATRAIEYVDKAAPAAPEDRLAPVAPIAAPEAVQAAPSAPAAPADPASPVPTAVEPLHAIHLDKGVVVMNGKTKRWRDLTSEERAEIQESIADARRELAEHRHDRDHIRVEIQQAMAEAKIDKEDLQRELAEARSEIASAMAEIDAHGAEMRRAGVDPEQLKASIRASMKGVENIDIEAIRKSALSSIDPAQIQLTVDKALRAAEAELDRVDDLNDEND